MPHRSRCPSPSSCSQRTYPRPHRHRAYCPAERLHPPLSAGGRRGGKDEDGAGMGPPPMTVHRPPHTLPMGQDDLTTPAQHHPVVHQGGEALSSSCHRPPWAQIAIREFPTCLSLRPPGDRTPPNTFCDRVRPRRRLLTLPLPADTQPPCLPPLPVQLQRANLDDHHHGTVEQRVQVR